MIQNNFVARMNIVGHVFVAKNLPRKNMIWPKKAKKKKSLFMKVFRLPKHFWVKLCVG